jgi:chromosomal replication initiator protein
MTELNTVWSAVIDDLVGELSTQDLGPLRLTRLRALIEDTALVDAPDAGTRDMIETRLQPALTAALRSKLGRAIPIAVRLSTAP